MVAKPSRQRVILPIAPLLGAVCGLSLALLIALVPADALEDAIVQSGLPAILPAAEPPLGVTARLGLTFVGAGGVGLLGWFLFFLLFGSRTMAFGNGSHVAEGDGVPVLRRADAHPDAPARRPLFASEDLGTPFLQVTAVDAEDSPSTSSFAAPHDAAVEMFSPIEPAIDLPADLDQPMAAFDPEAFAAMAPSPPAEPVIARVPQPEPMPLPLPRPQLFDPGERFETFELTPIVRPDPERAPAPIRREPAAPRPDTEATISALLERLERSVGQRIPAPRVPERANENGRLSDTLGELRQLATRAG